MSKSRLIRFSILPLVIASQLLYFVYFVSFAQYCTGTGSTYRATMFVCRRAHPLVDLDCFGASFVIVVIWIWGDSLKYINLFRIIALLHLFLFRFLLVSWMAQTQVVPFVPG